MVDEPEIRSFETDQGAQIYQLPLEAFPGFWAYAYLVLVDDNELGRMRVLIDTGSGFGYSNDYLETGLSKTAALSNESIGFNDLTHIFITHGHIDHIGGLAFVRPKSRASLGVHELDKRNLITVKPDSLATSRKGVFAGGDIINGGMTVVRAVVDGMKAAKEINEYLKK